MRNLALALLLALLFAGVSSVTAQPAKCSGNSCADRIGKKCRQHWECSGFSGRCRLRCEKIDRYRITGVCR